ncbi:permease (plasmid) [Gemmatirosa kalamazoonensis]|uniref:Permease n=1 Tax=Gemmatirosa kalamazoonensis TaxID=861299 RepID=W0RP46_9BACT|nr:ABC transporter permease [Gemmatirosa kalamazoonensis]AHG92257.1 permease [Gemmatirosa kalamazoonensis]
MRDAREIDWHREVRARLRATRLHPQDEAQVVDEIAEHLAAQYAELAPAIGPGAARERLLAELREPGLDDAAAARRRRARPAPTRVWGAGSLWRDVRYGMRSLRRSPGMVAAGAAALALGIGLTATVFSILYGLLLKGLPFDDAPRIAIVRYVDPRNGSDDLPIPFGDFVRYRAGQRSFETLGAYGAEMATVTGGDRPDRVRAARVTAGVFDVTRVRPLLGRTLVATDAMSGAPPVAVLGFATWRDRYGADSGVVGKVLRVDGHPYTVVGVMPERYEFPREVRVWLPLQLDAATARAGEGPSLLVVGRLRAGASYEQANAELTGMARRIATERTEGGVTFRAVVQPFIRGTIPVRVYSLFYAMLGAVMLVLLVACANVANLLLDRAAARTREIGIRTSLGASRLAVIRQSLVESTLIAAPAALLGTALAGGGVVAFNRAMAELEHPFWMDIRLHPAVLAFVLATTALASLVSGLLPALQSARLDAAETLKDESHAASSLRVGRLSRAIVGVEIALSSALLLASGFVTKSVAQLRAVEPGFATTGVYTAQVDVPAGDPDARRRFTDALERGLSSLPRVEAAYVGSGLPGTGWGGGSFAVEGRSYTRDQDYPSARSLAVSPGFFTTFGVRVLRGRAIGAADRGGATPVAVISESLARRQFADVDPLGQRLRLGGADGHGEWLTVVGVMPTLFAMSMRNPWPAEVLTALAQEPRAAGASAVTVALRGPVDAGTAIRAAVRAADPDAPVYDQASMEAVFARETWMARVLGTMFMIFGGVSLALAAIGLYAVMAFSVSRRTRELGIRAALGASRRDVIRMVLRQAAAQIALGMTAGFLVGGAIVRLARAALFEVQPGDPTVFAAVALVLGAAALVACLVPARRATKVDPLVALRID